MKYTVELLGPLVASSGSVAEILRKLGLREIGSTHTHVAKRIKQLGLDTTHFLGIRHNLGKKFSTRQKHWTEILVKRNDGRRQSAKYLRKALVDSGRPYRCGCGQGPEWNGKPLTLQVEHKNATLDDDSPDNLDFMCPNCHSQTTTHSKTRVVSARPKCACGRVLDRKNKSGVCWSCGRGKNSC